MLIQFSVVHGCKPDWMVEILIATILTPQVDELVSSSQLNVDMEEKVFQVRKKGSCVD